MSPSAALVIDDEPHIRRAVRNALEGDFDRILDSETLLVAGRDENLARAAHLK